MLSHSETYGGSHRALAGASKAPPAEGSCRASPVTTSSLFIFSFFFSVFFKI
jgi:hypothetical protein